MNSLKRFQTVGCIFVLHSSWTKYRPFGQKCREIFKGGKRRERILCTRPIKLALTSEEQLPPNSGDRYWSFRCNGGENPGEGAWTGQASYFILSQELENYVIHNF